ncbi:YeeE/YedE thiosulfate transporter family protein [Sphingobacterium sp. UT-1RO-CII-1]|uniref:YeeE/YedE family protein n=1 Tax=Sphingobacterium sp. UT-1RO-CII-1 TaxID=2995225 RepID=UPI00227D5088|nr:YeeE/YedE thiosulfate transporter family protein [Sphingobacterium sp. UT-1RO-CII-1]MCY4780456.1 YeeE/YedE thiosulfate transporter family protein [Sphingobacterium sp. UT-1RO-CII-1]
MEWLMNPWPWYVGGAIVAVVMLLLILLGKTFGFSSNFRTMCSALGGGKSCEFFRFDWKSQQWNLMFLLGTIIGGFLSVQFLSNGEAPDIATATVEKLHNLGFASAGTSYYPTEIFEIWSLKNIAILAIGGILVGFGTRYAGGCTSGHAISGLSDLQLPSLIAVIGFFIGGLVMVHVLFPLIF